MRTNGEQMELITGNKVSKYSKDFMKIKFESDDGLPISRIINIPYIIVFMGMVFMGKKCKSSSCVKC